MTVFSEIEAERKYQDGKWGHTVDDTMNTPWMWTVYINSHATKWMIGVFPPLSKSVVDDFRAKMIRTAALCVAAVESLDRQREEKSKAFYEEAN